jgi:hypothetical protein
MLQLFVARFGAGYDSSAFEPAFIIQDDDIDVFCVALESNPERLADILAYELCVIRGRNPSNIYMHRGLGPASRLP